MNDRLKGRSRWWRERRAAPAAASRWSWHEAGATVYCHRPQHPRGALGVRPARDDRGDRRAGRRPPAARASPSRSTTSSRTRCAALVAAHRRRPRPPRRAGQRHLGRRAAVRLGHASCGSTTWTTGLRLLRLAVETHLDHQPLRAAAADPPAGRARGGDDRRHRASTTTRTTACPRSTTWRRPRCCGWRSRQAHELAPHGCTAVALTPGLAALGDDARELRRDRGELARRRRQEPHFGISESPAFVGRAVAALAADPEVARWNGRLALLGAAGAGVRVHRRRRQRSGLLALHGRGAGRRASRPDATGYR